jgi:hypothetical protein
MNEFDLTFGQVIDQLKLGEIAVSNKMNTMKYDTNGVLVYFNEEHKGEQKVVIQSGYSQADKWKIQSSYVAFDVAMDELEDGNIIEFHKDGHEFRFKKENEYTLSEMARAGITFADLLNGNWKIFR